MDVVGSICFYFNVCDLTAEFHYLRKLMLIANSAANPFPFDTQQFPKILNPHKIYHYIHMYSIVREH